MLLPLPSLSSSSSRSSSSRSSARLLSISLPRFCSSVELYFQVGLQATLNNAILELFCQIINEPAFDTLRTKEQLGYIVFSGVRRSNGVQGKVVRSGVGSNGVQDKVVCSGVRRFIGV